MKHPQTLPWIEASEKVYRALLILYPVDFRREYGSSMAQVFRDVCRHKYQQQGRTGVVLWWCRTLLDLTFTVIEQRRKRELPLSKSIFNQQAGMFLIWGGVFGVLAAFCHLQPDDHSVFYGVYQFLSLLFVPSFLLIGCGCLGLATRYAVALGTPGQWTLYLTAFGSLVMVMGSAAKTALVGSLWNLYFVGVVFHVFALILFGVSFVRKPFLPIFRWLPLQIAAGWLMMAGFTDRFPQSTDNLLTFLLTAGVGLAWMGIGLVVNRPQQVTTLEAV